MTPAAFGPGAPLALEAGLFGLLVIVLLHGLVSGASGGRRAGWIAFIGLAALLGASFAAEPGASALGGSFVVDELAVFVKRVFLGSAALSVLASLGLGPGAFDRRSTEYHVALLASLLGMLVLASARELILLFVAFELMSIPLYFLTGFEKRGDTSAEASLKFFLVGTVSSAVFLYGLSFVFGVTGTTSLAAIPPAAATGHPLMTLGLGLVLAGLGFKIAAVPFHMWVPDSYEAASTPFVAWLAVAPKAAGFVAIFRIFLEGWATGPFVWVPIAATLAGVTIVAGNLMAIPQRNIKRLLAYSGIAHIGYMLLGLAAASASGVAMVLFYLVAYLFGNMGAFFVVQAVAGAERSDGIDAYRGLAQRSPVLALSMLIFLLSLGGIPFVAGFWAKLYVFWAAIEQGMYVLVFLGAVLTVVALYYYLLVARRMYIDAPERPDPIPVPPVLAVGILVCAMGVVAMGVYPEPWVSAALRVAATLF
jgi:NADH-quinone oxidoreductase subunit N